jgi:LacI family transcriptional regulator
MKTAQSALPTIDDVAQRAGVSTATVSRALNHPAAVSEALREKVSAAVLQLGYVPHAGARALMLRRSGTVGAVFPTVDNAIFASAIDSLQRRLSDADMQLVLATSGYDPVSEMRQAINLVTRGADALALCGMRQHPELLRFLRLRRVPWVHVMTLGSEGALCVGFDNARATREATRYLFGLGHRRIAMLAGLTKVNDRADERVQGVRQELAAVGLRLPMKRLVERAYGLTEARTGFRALIAHKPVPTAVICGNDVLAFGALLEANAMGLNVPRDISIIGFDDLEMARHLQPALTTVRVPTELMWFTAVDRLIGALRGEDVQRRTEIAVELIIRESTGPAAQLT